MNNTVDQIQELIQGAGLSLHELRYINQQILMPELRKAHDERFLDFANRYGVCDIAFVKFSDGLYYPTLIDSFSLADDNGTVRPNITKFDFAAAKVSTYYYYDSAESYDHNTIDVRSLDKVIHLSNYSDKTVEERAELIRQELITISSTYSKYQLPFDMDAFLEVISGY